MIEHAIRIEAPAETVFAMLTDADLLTEWMAREATVDRRPGGEFRWVYENGDVVRGRFVEIDVPHRLVLAHGWEEPASRGIPPGSTEVEITLEDTAGGTLLRLVHRRLPPAQMESHQYGWQYFLSQLANRLAGVSKKDRDMADTTALVDAYYNHWGSGDFDGFTTILADDFQFHGPLDSAHGPAAFVELIRRNAPMFGEVRFDDIHRVVDGQRAVNLYTFQAGPVRVPMAEAFEVRDDKIARIDLYFDPTPFRPPS